MKVGIDLGTTYSLISRMGGAGVPVLIPDCFEADIYHTPSVVYIPSGTAFVGQMVETLLEQQPEIKVIRFFKRRFGSSEPVYFDDSGTSWYSEAVAALLLKKLRFDVESFCSTSVEGAVVTVPAHFNDPQRKSVLASATLAEIEVLGLVEEPVAAALHYGMMNESHEQILLVYDFGGGTFDATVLSLDADGVYVLSKAGITELGGKELDEKVGEIVLGQFELALGAPIRLDARTLLELRRIAEEIKVELSLPDVSVVRRVVLLAGEAVDVEISKSEFHDAISGYLAEAEEVTLSCITDSGLDIGDVNAVILVGGSSMVPAVRQRLQRLFDRPGQQVLFHEPSKAVAYGAAIHAAQLSGEAEQYALPPELKGVTGYCVGVRTVDPGSGRVTVDTLIKKNMPLPARLRKTYYTTHPGQERMVLEFVQYRDAESKLISLGQLVVGPLPSPRQNYPIEVTVENLEDGTVAVQAFDAETGVELSQVFACDGDNGLARLATQRALVRSTFMYLFSVIPLLFGAVGLDRLVASPVPLV